MGMKISIKTLLKTNNMETIEKYSTLCFNSKKIAERNCNEIVNYFGSKLIDYKIVQSIDERLNKGYSVHYSLINTFKK